MSDVDAVQAEVVALLNELRDKALSATPDARWQRYEHGGGRLDTRHRRDHPEIVLDAYGLGNREHYAAWSPAAVLLLVGDDGLLRRRAQDWGTFLARRENTNLTLLAQSYLTDLRDTLRAMRVAS